MEINYLKEFVVLAQTGSFMEAADRLFSTQSTLSKHIQHIEKELGVPLFERTTRKVKISKFGELFLPYAKQIVEIQEKYTATLQSSMEHNQETLNLGCLPTLEYKITDILVNFKKTRPQSIINVMQSNSEELREMLHQDKCELAFIRYASKTDDGLEKIPYTEDEMVAILPANHPLAGQKAISLLSLANENFLLSDKSYMLYSLSIHACELSGFEPKVSFTDHRLENLIEMVAVGMGVSLTMKPLALYLANPKIAIVDFTPLVTTQIFLCYTKGKRLSHAAKHFIQCTRSQATILGLTNHKRSG